MAHVQGRSRNMNQPNILFIVVDALRSRNLGCYGYSKRTSPVIDKLATEGLLFENAFSCTTTTYPSLTSIFSGKYPLSHGITKLSSRLSQADIEKLDESHTTFLPEILRSKGYVTLSVDWLGRWLKRGYDWYSGIPNRRKIDLGSLVNSMKSILTLNTLRRDELMSGLGSIFQLIQLQRMNGEAVTDHAIDLIKQVHGRKFFLFVHYWDTHNPYNPPKQFLEMHTDSKYENSDKIETVLAGLDPRHSWSLTHRLAPGVKTVKDILVRYDGAISYVDHELGRMIEALNDFGILDDTLIILTADHGESLDEHEIYWTHHGLYDVTVHVPLIFRYPNFPDHEKVQALVQHVDLVPTILDVLDIDERNLALDGNSLAPLVFDKKETELRTAVYLEEADVEEKRAIRTNRYKYIKASSPEGAVCKECNRIHGGIEEFYDLKEDPEEKRNSVEENLQKADRLKRKLSEWEELCKYGQEKGENIAKRVRPSSKEEIAIERRLRDLGYFDE